MSKYVFKNRYEKSVLGHLDDIDKEILRILQEDCSLTLEETRRRLVERGVRKRVPRTTIHSKIRRMEDLGIIKGRKAILDAKLLGKEVIAFVFLNYEKMPGKTKGVSERGVVEQLMKLPEVQEIHMLAGDVDIIMKIRTENISDLSHTVLNVIRGMDGISQSRSAIVLRTWKETTSLNI